MSRLHQYLSYKKSVAVTALFLRVAPRLVQWRAYRTLAWLIRHALARIGFAAPGVTEAPRLIVLTKSIFIDDVMHGLVPRGRFDLFHMDRRVPKALVRPFLPYSVRDNSYKSEDPRMVAGKAAARDFLDALMPHLAAAFPFDAMITGNVVYWAEQELAGSVDRFGRAFVACHKESIQAPDLYEEMVLLRQQGNDMFQGTLALVYNRKTSAQLISGKMLIPGKLAVIGMPRLDRIHALRQQPDPKVAGNTVLCLLISKISQLRVLIEPSDPRRWERISDRTHDALLELARSRPDMRVVIKYKSTDRLQVEDLRRRWADNIPADLEFTMTGDLRELLDHARVVVGHNTTAIYEAIAAGRDVVVPHYDEAEEADFQGRLLDFGDTIERVLSPELLKLRVSALFDQPRDHRQLTEAERQLLIDWLGNADGRSSERMELGILEAIAAKKARRAVDTALIERQAA